MRSRANDEVMAEMCRDDPAFALELVKGVLADGDLEEWRVILRQVTQAVSRQPILPRPLREAIMQLKFRTAVLDSGDWLTVVNIARLAGVSPVCLGIRANRWQRQQRLFSIRHNGAEYFPVYGLAHPTGLRPVKALAKVMRVFGGTGDGWGMAGWFLSVSSLLGGKCPRDLLASAPERVIAAAQDAKRGVVHG